MPSTYLSKTYSGNGNRNKGTISVWCKFSDSAASADSTIFGAGNTGNDSDCTFLSVNGNGFGGISTRKIIFALRISGGTVYKAVSDNLIQDINGWYHIVVRWDTTLGTPNCDIYLNGEEVSYSSNNWSSVSQNTNTYIGGTAQPHYIGRGATNAMQNNYMDGCLSHMHYCDGYYYDASTFGSTDATTGEWKINTNPSVSYGTNGFFFFKDDNALTDHSPNSNSYSLTAGTLTKTEDNPSNVFCTINVLSLAVASMTIQSGNTAKRTQSGSNLWRTEYGTLGASSGKFYYECKIEQINSSDPNNFWIGIVDADQMYNGTSNHRFFQQSRGYGYHAQTGASGYNNNTYTYGATYTTGDIIGVALDLDNSKLYFHKNGTYQNSGVPTSGSTGTGAISISSGYTYLPAISQYYSDEKWSANFGNGDFNAAGISSAGTNASNNGIFEYDVPTGYTALSTKGLNL